MSVRSIEAEVSIKSGVQTECTIGREVVVEIHDDVNLETLTATENGSYRPESGVDGWNRVTVEVPERQPVTEPLSVTANGQYEPSEGVDGFSNVSVQVPERIPVTESLSVTENGLYEPSEGVDGYDRVSVSVPERVPVTESLTATTNGVYEPDSGVDGYDHVTVAVPERQPDIETLTATANGTYTSGKDGYNPVVVAVPERQPITESLSVTENGTYTPPSGVDGFNSVTVDVPTGITPSGSQTFTENGTYDVASLAEAVVNVQASGGVHTEEGYVELTDTQTGQIVIPVDLRNAEGFVLNAYVTETGEVSDGAVTKYDKIEIPTEFSGTNKQFIYSYAVKYPQNPIPEIYRDSSNLVSVRQVVNVNYNFAYRGNNGSSVGINLNPTINANGVTLPAMNATRYFCMAGAYVKFKYEIKWW